MSQQASISDKVRSVVLDDIKEMRVLFIDDYARTNGAVIKKLHAQGIIDDHLLEEALERAVFKQARTDYKMMMMSGSGPLYVYADRLGRTDCFAYALKHRQFTPEEIEHIPFDHGQSSDTYVQRHGKEDLLRILKEDLFNPKPQPDSHPCCSCGY